MIGCCQTTKRVQEADLLAVISRLVENLGCVVRAQTGYGFERLKQPELTVSNVTIILFQRVLLRTFIGNR